MKYQWKIVALVSIVMVARLCDLGLPDDPNTHTFTLGAIAYLFLDKLFPNETERK